MIRFCHKELAHPLGAQLLLVSFISEIGLQLKYSPSFIWHTILVIPMMSLLLPQSEDLEDLLWPQRKPLKVFFCVIILSRKMVLVVLIHHMIFRELLLNYL